MELQHHKTVHDHAIALANERVLVLSRVSTAAKAVFNLASSLLSKTGRTTSIVFCGMLRETYIQAQVAAVSFVEEARNAVSAASAAVAIDPTEASRDSELAAAHSLACKTTYLEQVSVNITHAKDAIFLRIQEHFPGAVQVIEAAKTANIPAIDTMHVVMGGCFDSLERGLCSNALSRGPIGPECPVCYEDLDTTLENTPHSLIILECLLPRDYAHGPMHHLCQACWIAISRQALQKGKKPCCPNCRVDTRGQTVSQCSYGVMTDLMIP